MNDNELIEKYVVVDASYPSPDRAWLRGYGVDVWALIGYLDVVDGSLDQVATDYDLPREALDAALAYYRRHKNVIDARLTLNKA
jgi:uncharacterized protein (DUF433 family)